MTNGHSKPLKICIFCSANNNIAEEYFQQTEALGQWCARNGHTVIFGGTNQGLMECVARAAYETGGQVVGVVPRIVEQGGRSSQHMQKALRTLDLNDRKAIMIERADVLVALPGGVGTLDEIFTVLSAASIGYHHKRVILFNINGFWQQLITLMDDLQARGMIRGHWTDQLLVANTFEELTALIK